MAKIILSAIAAMAENRAIGGNNALPWHIPEDFKYFKTTTMGKPIIMGRKSFEALGKPLTGRPNIVISRKGGTDGTSKDGPFYVETIEEGIKLGEKMAKDLGQNEIFITGGGEIYKQTLDQLDKLYLTIIHRNYEGETFFPEFNRKKWTVISEDKRKGDPDYTFYVFKPA